MKPQAVVKPPRVEEHNLGAAMGLLFPLSFVKFKGPQFVLEVCKLFLTVSDIYTRALVREGRGERGQAH